MNNSRQEPPPAGADHAMRPRLVLLVDENANQRKLNMIQLNEAGYEVEVATSATEALRMAASRPPDAMMCEVDMCELDGFTLCRAARREPQLASIPIVLMSTRFQERCDQELAAAAGANVLIQRTPSFTVELAALAQLLESQAQRDQMQKTVWQIADVVAHDLNNILTGIIVNSSSLIEDLHEGDQCRHDAVEIKQAAERAAALTRQLMVLDR